ncbi:hypothetical protein Tco_1178751, partial [Tanacetum coccineum]
HHNNVSKRPQSDKHAIKLDAVLENLKFANKGEKDSIYGVAIPKDMMSDEIKASADYLNYLKEAVRVPRKKRTETIIEEIGVENVSSIAQFLLDMKKARKASKDDYIIQQRPKGLGEGSSIVLDAHDEPSDSSSSSHSRSNDEEGFLQTNDEELKDQSDDERTKTGESEKDGDKKFEDDKDVDEKAGEEQVMDDQAGIEQAGKV